MLAKIGDNLHSGVMLIGLGKNTVHSILIDFTDILKYITVPLSSNCLSMTES